MRNRRLAVLTILMVLGMFVTPPFGMALFLFLYTSMDRIGKWIYRKVQSWKQ